MGKRDAERRSGHTLPRVRCAARRGSRIRPETHCAPPDACPRCLAAAAVHRSHRRWRCEARLRRHRVQRPQSSLIVARFTTAPPTCRDVLDGVDRWAARPDCAHRPSLHRRLPCGPRNLPDLAPRRSSRRDASSSALNIADRGLDGVRPQETGDQQLSAPGQRQEADRVFEGDLTRDRGRTSSVMYSVQARANTRSAIARWWVSAAPRATTPRSWQVLDLAIVKPLTAGRGIERAVEAGK